MLFAAALLGGCSDLDPSIGPRRVDPVIVADADLPDTGDDAELGDRFFARNIRPLMNRASRGDPTGRGCKSCHYRSEANHTGLDLSGLDLTTLGSLRRGGGSSRASIVVAGKPAESILLQALKGTYGFSNQMPKNGNPFWTDPEIGLVTKWISEGAKGADDE